MKNRVQNCPVKDNTDENTQCERKQGIVPETSKRKAEPAKFKFKKRGRLEKKEMEELKKTHASMVT